MLKYGKRDWGTLKDKVQDYWDYPTQTRNVRLLKKEKHADFHSKKILLNYYTNVCGPVKDKHISQMDIDISKLLLKIIHILQLYTSKEEKGSRGKPFELYKRIKSNIQCNS